MQPARSLRQVIEERRRSEAAAMERRIPVACDGRQMVRRRISLVAIVPVPRIGRMMLGHFTVAGHLCHDGCRGNRAAAAIAVHHRPLREEEARDAECVDEYQVRQGCDR